MGFFSSLLGKDSAKAAEALGQRNAGQINTSYDKADTQAKTGFDESMGYYKPYAATGEAANTAYGNALGLNGQAARDQQFKTGYVEDPARAYRDANAQTQMNALYRKYNAGPSGVNSGATMMASGRLSNELFNTDWNGYLDRLKDGQAQGAQVAGAQAGTTTGYYNGLADRSVNRGNAIVNNDTQATMAASNAKQAGINNLLSIGGTIAGLGTRMYLGGGSGSSAGSGAGGYDANRWGYTRVS